MKKYNDRLQAKNDSNTSNNQNNKINILLKIFEKMRLIVSISLSVYM
jgi:hypothetical protein